MKAIGVLVLLAAVGAGLYFAVLKPVEIPELTLLNASGQRVTTAELRGDGEAILMVILLPNCPVSKYSAGLLTEQMNKTSLDVAFAGLVYGDRAGAAKLQRDWGLTFPCFGLKDAPDPLAFNALIEEVGTRRRVTGGTILLLDSENKLLFKLENDEIKELADRLADAGF